MSDQRDDLERQFEELSNSTDQLLGDGHFRSTYQRNGEVVRLAKANGLVLHWINGTFFQMVRCLALLDPKQLRDSAIRLVPYLEDEEQVRSFQSDYSEEYYDFMRHWMTACVYENLADATGEVDGYNSDGMHQCIADGLQVCHTTGKLECISCFREYAATVYLAADDFMMARHQCETVLNHTGSWADKGDIRSNICDKLSTIHLIEGRVAKAIEVAEEGIALAGSENVTLPFVSRLESLARLDEALILAGRERVDWSKPDPANPDKTLPPAGEWPELERLIAQNTALQHSMHGEHEAAIRILVESDRMLDRNSCLATWFETRLRVIAAFSLAGQTDRVPRLADQLRERAAKANDYLTLRRLDLLLDDEAPVTPVAAVEPLDTGPFATQTAAASIPAESNAESPAAASGDSHADSGDEDDELPPIFEKIQSLIQQFFSTEDEREQNEVVSEYLAMTGDTIDDPKATAALMHFAEPLNGDGERAAEFWEWAQTFEKRFPDTAGVISRVASMANMLRYSGGETTYDLIDGELIERLFKRALSLDPNSVSAHWLAGEHYLRHDELAEAERCLARACRLDRAFSRSALLLANVYQQTDRPRDALHVLDACLREGCDDSAVAWEAMVSAISTGQFESALTYSDRHDELADEPEAWVNYYRAIALLECGRGHEALSAIEAESNFELPGTYHLDVLRTSALMTLDRPDEARASLAQLLESRVSTVDYLTQVGLVNVCELLWRFTGELADDDEHRGQLRKLLLATGMMPSSFFDEQRTSTVEAEAAEPCGVNFYQVLVEQTLPSDWRESIGCLTGQQHWQTYRIVWGVLAEDEEQAGQLVLEWQRRCEDGPAEVLEVSTDGEGFRDVPGVVWQGVRWSEDDEPE